MIQVSEQGSRKNLYQRIVLQFPEGWMNSGQISREGVLSISWRQFQIGIIEKKFLSSECNEEEI